MEPAADRSAFSVVLRPLCLAACALAQTVGCPCEEVRYRGEEKRIPHKIFDQLLDREGAIPVRVQMVDQGIGVSVYHDPQEFLRVLIDRSQPFQVVLCLVKLMKLIKKVLKQVV